MYRLKPDWYREAFFPFPEGREWEFKEYGSLKSANRSYKDTWRRTIVAFLNASGGVLLLGIRDNGQIVGIPATVGDIDDFKRIIDGMIMESIYLNDGSHIHYRAIVRVEAICLDRERYIIALNVYPLVITNEERYFVCRNGDRFLRLNACNCRVPKEPLFTQIQVNQILTTQKKIWQSEMEQSQTAKHKEIECLQSMRCSILC